VDVCTPGSEFDRGPVGNKIDNEFADWEVSQSRYDRVGI
jgi:hypothetical protein